MSMMIAKMISNPPPVRLLLCILLTVANVLNEVKGRDYFNPALLERTGSTNGDVDLSGFETGQQAEGTYHVDILLNGENVDTRDVVFTRREGGMLEPCLSTELLEGYGVKTALYPGLVRNENCADLSAIPQVSSELLFSSQKLLLSIPQAALSSPARGYVAPDQWDEGITAMMLNYSLSVSVTSRPY